MVFGREKPLSEAFFLSIVVGRALAAWGLHPVGCGSQSLQPAVLTSSCVWGVGGGAEPGF